MEHFATAKRGRSKRTLFDVLTTATKARKTAGDRGLGGRSKRRRKVRIEEVVEQFQADIQGKSYSEVVNFVKSFQRKKEGRLLRYQFLRKYAAR